MLVATDHFLATLDYTRIDWDEVTPVALTAKVRLRVVLRL
jgi:hypothetical protein